MKKLFFLTTASLLSATLSGCIATPSTTGTTKSVATSKQENTAPVNKSEKSVQPTTQNTDSSINSNKQTNTNSQNVSNGNVSTNQSSEKSQLVDSTVSESLPVLSITPSKTQVVDLHIENLSANLKINEIKINYYSDSSDSKTGYTDELFHGNNGWQTNTGSLVGTANSDGSIGLDLPNGYIANDAQVTVVFKNSNGQTFVVKSKIFNAGNGKF